MTTRNWLSTEKDEAAWHVEYEIRKLTEYVNVLDEFRDRPDVGQALLEASLVRIRALHEFLRPTPALANNAFAGLWVSTWGRDGFLSGRDYDRISAKVAHLSASRLRAKFDDFEPAEIKPLAVRCCECLGDFLDSVPAPEPAGFLEAREHVAKFLART